MGKNILKDLKRDNNFRYFLRAGKRINRVGFLFFLKELYLYYQKYSRFPKLIGIKKINLKYRLFVLYNYFKIVAVHPTIELKNLLLYFPTRMQEYFIYKLDPKESRVIMFDKSLFYKKLKEYNLPFPVTYFYTIDGSKIDDEGKKIKNQLENIPDKVFVKPIRDNGGVNAGFILKENLQTIVDGFVVQEIIKNHAEIVALSGDIAFNTVRVITYLDNNNEVHILSAIYRLSKNKEVDNWGKGSINVPIDIETGVLGKDGITKNFETYDKHPLGKIKFVDFKIPEWGKLIEIVIKGAELFNELRFIAWDIGISTKGPIIVEANAGCDFFHAQLFQPYGDSVLIKDLLAK